MGNIKLYMGLIWAYLRLSAAGHFYRVHLSDSCQSGAYTDHLKVATCGLPACTAGGQAQANREAPRIVNVS